MFWKWITFAAASLVLIVISAASLVKPRSHGFYRFFAWESIAGLFILNIDHWLSNPFSWYQIIAWTLLFLSIVPVVWGAILLKERGRPTKERNDETLIAFEKTTQLVTTGIYKYIRHPLYSSLLLLAWGIFFKLPSWPGILLAAAATVFLLFTAQADEEECRQYFGARYEAYMQQTTRFIPFLF
ncbi:MAG: isoprenylcysteine carboxylmethyltransferase family protein [Anaerolineales bacterium]|nr:isoprenylcysteine carboxylmethyltransferase family protein [Anaerolineales bacterium]